MLVIPVSVFAECLSWFTMLIIPASIFAECLKWITTLTITASIFAECLMCFTNATINTAAVVAECFCTLADDHPTVYSVQALTGGVPTCVGLSDQIA